MKWLICAWLCQKLRSTKMESMLCSLILLFTSGECIHMNGVNHYSTGVGILTSILSSILSMTICLLHLVIKYDLRLSVKAEILNTVSTTPGDRFWGFHENFFDGALNIFILVGFGSEFNGKLNETIPRFLSLIVFEIIAKNWEEPGENRVFLCLLDRGLLSEDLKLKNI